MVAVIGDHIGAGQAERPLERDFDLHSCATQFAPDGPCVVTGARETAAAVVYLGSAQPAAFSWLERGVAHPATSVTACSTIGVDAITAAMSAPGSAGRRYRPSVVSSRGSASNG